MKENTKEKSLQIIDNKNNIFYKIKNFFKNLFSKKINTDESSDSLEINNINNNKKTFTEKLRFNTYLIELQKRLKQGEIRIKDLSDKEKDDMIELYQKQISEKKNKLKNLNQEISFYRKKLENN